MIRQLRAVHCFQEDTSIVRLNLGPSRRSSGFSSIDAFTPALAPAGTRRGLGRERTPYDAVAATRETGALRGDDS